MKLLVIYTFSQPSKNVEYFIEHAIFQDKNIDFLVVVNSLDTLPYILPAYVKVVHRENTGYDFGAWNYGLFLEENYTKYHYYLFANESAVGPFLPNNPIFNKWTDYYVNGLKPTIKLFGSTISNVGVDTPIDASQYAHVQSYIFCMGKNTLKLLIEKKLFDPSGNEMDTLIDTFWKKEMKMSRIIIRNGQNIGCLLPYYKDVNFVNIEKNKNITFLGDVMAPEYLYQQSSELGSTSGTSDSNLTGNLVEEFNGINQLWKPEDVIFMKGNRFEEVDLSSFSKK